MAEHSNPFGNVHNFDGEDHGVDHPDSPVDGVDQIAAEADDQGPAPPARSVEQEFAAANSIKVSPPSGRGPRAQSLTNPHTRGGRHS